MLNHTMYRAAGPLPASDHDRTIRAGRFELVDEQGRARGWLGFFGKERPAPQIALADLAGRPRVELYVDDPGNGDVGTFVNLLDKDSNSRLSLHLDGRSGEPGISVADGAGNVLLSAWIEDGRLVLRDQSGELPGVPMATKGSERQQAPAPVLRTSCLEIVDPDTGRTVGRFAAEHGAVELGMDDRTGVHSIFGRVAKDGASLWVTAEDGDGAGGGLAFNTRIDRGPELQAFDVAGHERARLEVDKESAALTLTAPDRQATAHLSARNGDAFLSCQLGEATTAVELSADDTGPTLHAWTADGDRQWDVFKVTSEIQVLRRKIGRLYREVTDLFRPERAGSDGQR